MMSLVKHRVCVDCLSLDIVNADCRCVYSRDYETIELEFEVCSCCGNTNAHPADTDFNKQALKQK